MRPIVKMIERFFVHDLPMGNNINQQEPGKKRNLFEMSGEEITTNMKDSGTDFLSKLSNLGDLTSQSVFSSINLPDSLKGIIADIVHAISKFAGDFLNINNGTRSDPKKEKEEEKKKKEDAQFRNATDKLAEQRKQQAIEWANERHKFGNIELTGTQWGELAKKFRDPNDADTKKTIDQLVDSGDMSKTEAVQAAKDAAAVAEDQSRPPGDKKSAEPNLSPEQKENVDKFLSTMGKINPALGISSGISSKFGTGDLSYRDNFSAPVQTSSSLHLDVPSLSSNAPSMTEAEISNFLATYQKDPSVLTMGNKDNAAPKTEKTSSLAKEVSSDQDAFASAPDATSGFNLAAANVEKPAATPLADVTNDFSAKVAAQLNAGMSV